MTYPILAEIRKAPGKGGKLTDRAFDVRTGEDITRDIAYVTVKGATKAGTNIAKVSEGCRWERVPKATTLAELEQAALAVDLPHAVQPEQPAPTAEVENTDPVVQLLKTVVSKRPSTLYCEDLTWRIICRNTLRAKNILLTGPTGCGKSQTAFAVAKALERPLFYINLGATQDPRGSLIGNTHFSKDAGTYFNQSAFIKAISTPNTVVVLDEISRAHPEAWNILMTVLDPGQRYVRLDEEPGCPTIHVAEGVSFIGTANIGSEYTAVRVMDRALLDRFEIVEIPFLTVDQETALVSQLYPTINRLEAGKLAEMAKITRDEVSSDSARISTPISTRSVVLMAGMLLDGFTLQEAATVSVCPQYSKDGGDQSERTFIMQTVQKFVNDGTADSLIAPPPADDLDF